MNENTASIGGERRKKKKKTSNRNQLLPIFFCNMNSFSCNYHISHHINLTIWHLPSLFRSKIALDQAHPIVLHNELEVQKYGRKCDLGMEEKRCIYW